jgi:pimeloyl-ACP methyl ester carboxylesterase
MERSWTSVPSLGISVYAHVLGGVAAPPVVLVAGMGMAGGYWMPLAKRLARRFRVIVPDLPGFGRTPPPAHAGWPAGPNPREQADQVLAWMDAFGLQRATLVGHSTGCQTVADLAIRFPARVDRLILAGPPFPPGHRTFLEQVLRLTWAAVYEKLSLYRIVLVDYWRAMLPRIVQQALRAMHDPLEAKLPQITADTLIIAGRLDPLATVAWCQRFATLLQHGQLAVIEDAGHAMQFRAPDATAAVIERFLGPPL